MASGTELCAERKGAGDRGARLIGEGGGGWGWGWDDDDADADADDDGNDDDIDADGVVLFFPASPRRSTS